MVHTCNLALRKLRQEDGELGYTVRPSVNKNKQTRSEEQVALHAQGYDDLVVCLHRSQPPLDNRIGELVGMLAAHCQG